MKRPSRLLLLLSLPFFGLLNLGCQRSMNGSMASGPFAPAGTASPGGSSPLFPMGPITGATRVPPPATGTSSASNGYIGAPSASNFTTPSTLQANNNSVNAASPSDLGASGAFANQSVAVPGNSFRNSLGGMPAIDLTSQLKSEQAPTPTYGNSSLASSAAVAGNQAYGNFAASAPIGSGVYPAPYATETSVHTALPSQLLRPIDQPYAAVPVPRYRGMEPSSFPGNATLVPSVAPAGGFPASDAWQSVSSQPVPAASYSSGPNVGVTQTGPSTEPVRPASSAPAAQVASPSLPWRSPTTAR
jgi:hypothetical protein